MPSHRTSIDKTAVIRVVGKGYSKAAARRAAQKMKDNARLNVLQDGLVDSGKLLNSFRIKDETVDPMMPTMKVYSTSPTAKFPEFGTQGSEAAPGKVLRFKPKGSSVFIFRKKVSGVRPYKFMTRAKNSLRARDFLTKS